MWTQKKIKVIKTHKAIKSNWPRQPSAAPSRLNRWQESVHIPPYFQRLTASIKECEKWWAGSWWEWQSGSRKQKRPWEDNSSRPPASSRPGRRSQQQLYAESHRGEESGACSPPGLVLPELCRRGEVDWTSARLVNVHLAGTETQILPCSCCSLQMSQQWDANASFNAACPTGDLQHASIGGTTQAVMWGASWWHKINSFPSKCNIKCNHQLPAA